MAYSPITQGYTVPTDAKRWLTHYAANQTGWDADWRQYMPVLARYFEGDIDNPGEHIPYETWQALGRWFGTGNVQGISDWGPANPLNYTPQYPGSFQYMLPDWWRSGYGGVYDYNPTQPTPPPTSPPTAPQPPPDNKPQWYRDKMLEGGVMGNLMPNMSGAMLPQLAQAPQMPNYQNEQQPFIPYQNPKKWTI